MTQYLKSAMGCLLILCFLLSGCTAPNLTGAVATDEQSQKPAETTGAADKITQLVPGEPVTPIPEVPAETPEAVPTKAPEEVPAKSPEAVPAKAQEEVPAKTPEAAPTKTPEEVPAKTPEAVPTKAQEEVPAETPEAVPAKAQEEVPAETQVALGSETRPNPNTGATPQGKTAAKNVRLPTASGSEVYSDAGASFDVSNSSEGYVMAKYTGSKSKVKLRITKSGGTTYTHNLTANGKYETFPLSEGSGTYTIAVFENVSGTQYAPGLSKNFTAKITNSNTIFLYPNRYVNFSASSAVVTTATSLAQSAKDDLDFVEKVYDYAMDNITYDYEKAKILGTSDYVPNADSTISTGKGVCYDYAVVMAAMLRSQGIPTKLVMGIMNGNIKHAWISTYISNVGWINGVISFDGKSWVRMDPTTADQGNEAYTATASNYQTLNTY